MIVVAIVVALVLLAVGGLVWLLWKLRNWSN